jgi:hypothetical protein
VGCTAAVATALTAAIALCLALTVGAPLCIIAAGLIAAGSQTVCISNNRACRLNAPDGCPPA